MAMLIVARLAIREAARRRLLLALAVLSVLVVGLTAWGFARLPDITNNGERLSAVEVQTSASQLLILVMFMFAGVIALSAIFVAAPAIAGEVESGIALAMLSRPLRRRDVVLGKWLGCAALLIGYTAAVCALEFWVAGRATGYYPPRPLLAVAYLAGEGLVLLTVALALSTRLAGMTGGIVSTVLFFVAWMTGVIGGIGIALGNPGVAHVGTISRLILPSDGLWRGAIYALEPAALLMEARALPRLAGDPFLVDASPSVAYPLWAACWVLGVLGVAIYSFGRREL